MKIQFSFLLAILLLSSCTTDPIIPDNYQPGNGGIDLNNEPLCESGVISFQQQVLPLITNTCAMSGCHDPISKEEGVILIDYNTILREVKPFNANQSSLYKVLVKNDPDDVMPPPPANRYSQENLDIIANWINQGALNTTCQILCDSTQVSTYSGVVAPIVEKFCVGCHNANLGQGNIKLHTYALVKESVQSGAFMGTIEHAVSYPKMPTSGVKLSDCNISLLKQWIQNGMPNN